MFFTLDVRRARKGDCLILHYGTEAKPGLALIDGGPSNVYKPHLKPRLAEIREARGLDPDATLPVDCDDGQSHRRRSHPGHARTDERAG